MNRHSVQLFSLFLVLALVWTATNRFESPDQNLVASTDVTVRSGAPTVNDDIDFNFLAGYIWIDVSGGAVYILEDNSDGAAVWTDITAGGSTFNGEEEDSLVISNVSVIDFGPGFDLTDEGSGELRVVLDYSEDAVSLSGADVTGTLDISDHTNLVASTGITLTGDTLTVDLGASIDTSEIVDGTILVADLNSADTPGDGECATYESATGNIEWNPCASGGSGTLTTIKDGGVQVGDADIVTLDFGDGITCSESPDTEVNCAATLGTSIDISDETNLSAGTGATLTGDEISVDLGTSIDTSEIVDGTILEADLAAVDTPNDEECLTYEATGGDFEWQTCSPGGGGGTLTTIKEGGSQIGDADIVALDFGPGFDCTESPDTEINCVFDFTEDPVDLGSAEVTGTLTAGNGGLGQTSATADSVPIGNGTSFTLRAVPDCNAAGNAINYNTTTDSWSCATGYLTSVDISDDTNLTCGTNCTLTGDEISVDDAFILNTGDIGTGSYDFGGADDFEIPNGATESPNAAGEVAIDTTDDQLKYFGAAERVLTYKKTFSAVLEDPADADNFLLLKAPHALTITDIHCIVDPADTAESVVIDVQERDGTGDNPASVDATITCDNDGAEDDGTLTNGAIDSGDWISLDIGTVTGTVTQVVVTVTYTVDAA